jgi:hypothetical protein
VPLGKKEKDDFADEAFDLFREELARYPIPSTRAQETYEKINAFKAACSKDDAAVARLAELRGSLTWIVNICYFAILIVLTVYHQPNVAAKLRNKKV